MGQTKGDGNGDGAAKKRGLDDKWYQRHVWKARIEGEGGELGAGG
jgi:hypothetical protein